MSTKVKDIVTQAIIDQIKKDGQVPWQKPWTSQPNTNLISGKPYKGFNRFFLSWMRHAYGYTSNYWLTFKQIQAAGGKLRKGSEGSIIVFNTKKSKDVEEAGQTVQKPYWVMRYYTVFNASCVDGLDIPKSKDIPLHRSAQALVDNMPNAPVIITGQEYAAYAPIPDNVKMPEIGTFKSQESYYSVLFHELGHSTGHEKRLNRAGVMSPDIKFGTKEYAREELVAELSAAMLCSYAGITPEIDNSAAYIASWIKTLSEDSGAIIWAANRADAACNYILGIKPEGEEHAS